MNWNETSNLAIEALRANKLRATLTMLGVIIGSACIVLVVTVALTGKRYIGDANRSGRLQYRLCLAGAIEHFAERQPRRSDLC